MSYSIEILCWLGVLQSLLIAVFLFARVTQNFSKLFLGACVLLACIRAAKSTLFAFHLDVPNLILNMGFAAHAALGPTLLFYIYSLKQDFRWKLADWLHFTPAVSIVVTSSILTLNGFWYRGGYAVLLFYTLAYIGLSAWHFTKIRRQVTKGSLALMVAFAVFLMSYFSNYILRLTDYVAGPMIYSVFIVSLSFVAVHDHTLFVPPDRRKYRNLRIPPEKEREYGDRILRAMVMEKLFLDPDLTLQKISSSISVPTHIMSYVINSRFAMSFTALVNHYRVEEAKRLLVDPLKQHVSVAGIALECGFNSLSSFNTAFKKMTGVTPTEFRRKKC